MSLNAVADGLPPVNHIEIPRGLYSSHFDMAVDNDNVIFLSYESGVKIFDGTRWKEVQIPVSRFIRKLHFDGEKRVYYGGWQTLGYVSRDEYGSYFYIDLTPQQVKSSLKSIWGIQECNGEIYFKGLHYLFKYNPQTEELNQWRFQSRLGAQWCQEDKAYIQERGVGIKTFNQGQWDLTLINIEEGDILGDAVTLKQDFKMLLSSTASWKYLNKQSIFEIQFKGDLLPQSNYETIAALNSQQFVLGANNGYLTFVDIKTRQAETFKLTNDWIAKIIYKDGQLIVLTEWKVFYFDWPAPWRVQGRNKGLEGEILNINTWNDDIFILTRSGAYREPKHNEKRYQRMSWTSNESWDLIDVGENQALFAESHHLIHLHEDQATKVSEVIYPREFKPSYYNSDLIFLRTELDVRVINKKDPNWSANKIFDGVILGMAQLGPEKLLISNFDNEVYELTFDSEFNNVEQERVSLPKNITYTYVQNLDKERVIALTDVGVFEYQNGTFVKNAMYGISDIMDVSDVQNMMFINDELWMDTGVEAYYLETSGQWVQTNIKSQLKSGIYGLKSIFNEIKFFTPNEIITFYKDKVSQRTDTSRLFLSDIIVKSAKDSYRLPLESENRVLSAVDSEIKFNFALTGLREEGAVKFRHFLKNHQNQWSEYNSNNNITFANLPAGDYEFQIQAQTTDGIVYNASPYFFSKAPYWYLTRTAKTIWVILSLVMILLVLNWYLKRRERIHILQKQALKKVINKKTQELMLANKRLLKIAHQDGLTGLSNRVYLKKYIDQLIKSKETQICVLMMDMDHFKAFNDTHGHIAGDKLLIDLARCLSDKLEDAKNLVARYGGEEFLAIIPQITLKEGMQLAENIRVAIENLKQNVTLSIGIAHANLSHFDVDEILHIIDLADKAMYNAKSQGRNQVVVSDHREDL